MTAAYSIVPSTPISLRAPHSYSEIDQQRDVFESQRHHIFSVAYYMTGDEREAEAILARTFIEAFERHAKPSALELDGTLLVELERRMDLTPVPPMQIESGELGSRNVRRTDMEEALWQLPAPERLCFLLRDVEGYSPERIAELLNTPQSEIQRTVLSARLRMRSLLAQRGPAAA